MPDEIGVQHLITTIKENGYYKIKVYAENTHVRFVIVRSTFYRKDFVIELPKKYRSTSPDHTLELIENNYLSFRQRDYMSHIALDQVACLTDKNICLKREEDYTCYKLDVIPDEEQDQMELKADDAEIDAEAEDDIEIDDFPIGVLMPVFDLQDFLNNVEQFEEILAQHYDTITANEEEMNSNQVQEIIRQFQEQEKSVKEKMFEIHKSAYHLRRDLTKYGANLAKLFTLKEKHAGGKDLVRFKVDRLIVETEERIDTLNLQLMRQRNKADILLKKYNKYIETFERIN